MPEKPKNIVRKESQYRNRILACVIAAEIILIALFQFWPSPDKTDEVNREKRFAEDALAIEEVVRTEQQNRPASPPKPQTPIPKPTDKVFEEEIVEIKDENVLEYSDSLSKAMLGNQGDSGEPLTNPEISPSVIRIVEPTVPDAAKKAKIKAEIWVNFLVDENGRVEEANISRIKVYDRNSGEAEEVESIDYGLTEATLNAALQWKFRPAKNNGKPVKAYTRHIFTFGFSR